jgi:hypothetical protein
MAKKFSELEAKMSPESIARSNETAKGLRYEMPLKEFRPALDITEEQRELSPRKDTDT